ncbi:hypothetical protein [Actinophytocola sp.]|uniref:hypothetical protein n=1 Tax=Actinophytocola sp. TaxID=1872138 RepID=UPI00389AFE77
MDARRKFLENVEAELAGPTDSGRDRTRIRRVGGIAAGLLAGVSFLTLTAGAASAAVATPSDTLADSCFQPNHVQYTHTKQCPSITWVQHIYKYTYSPNGGLRYCYVFDSEVHSPCGDGTYESESCG